MESSGTLLTHPGFFKQRMQSHHFQYFNVISQKDRKKKKRMLILCIWTDSCVSRSFSVLVQRRPHGQMAGDSCYLVRKHEGLVLKRNACVRACVCVWCALWGSGMVEVCSWISVGDMRAQSRASSGWVFSLSPWSSCFSVPASTTDWDLFMGLGEASLSRLDDACFTCIAL